MNDLKDQYLRSLFRMLDEQWRALGIPPAERRARLRTIKREMRETMVKTHAGREIANHTAASSALPVHVSDCV